MADDYVKVCWYKVNMANNDVKVCWYKVNMADNDVKVCWYKVNMADNDVKVCWHEVNMVNAYILLTRIQKTILSANHVESSCFGSWLELCPKTKGKGFISTKRQHYSKQLDKTTAYVH